MIHFDPASYSKQSAPYFSGFSLSCVGSTPHVHFSNHHFCAFRKFHLTHFFSRFLSRILQPDPFIGGYQLRRCFHAFNGLPTRSPRVAHPRGRWQPPSTLGGFHQLADGAHVGAVGHRGLPGCGAETWSLGMGWKAPGKDPEILRRLVQTDDLLVERVEFQPLTKEFYFSCKGGIKHRIFMCSL